MRYIFGTVYINGEIKGKVNSREIVGNMCPMQNSKSNDTVTWFPNEGLRPQLKKCAGTCLIKYALLF